MDLATIGEQVWEMVVAFGGLKGTLEVFEVIVRMVRERRSRDPNVKLELAGPRGEKLVVEGSMTSDELDAELRRFREVLEDDGADQ